VVLLSLGESTLIKQRLLLSNQGFHNHLEVPAKGAIVTGNSETIAYLAVIQERPEEVTCHVVGGNLFPVHFETPVQLLYIFTQLISPTNVNKYLWNYLTISEGIS
jgi:hypothetical protein